MIKVFVHDKNLEPKVGSEHAAGMDLRSPIDFKLEPGEEINISLGVHVEIPHGTVALIGPRSSISNQKDLLVVLKNTIGFIDSDYRGQLGCRLVNKGTSTLVVYKYERFLQMIVLPIIPASSMQMVGSLEDLSNTSRGSGGFGSTGRQ